MTLLFGGGFVPLAPRKRIHAMRVGGRWGSRFMWVIPPMMVILSADTCWTRKGVIFRCWKVILGAGAVISRWWRDF